MASEAPPPRRWASRLLHLLPRRRRRANDSQRVNLTPDARMAAVRLRRLDAVDDAHDNNHAHERLMYSVLADLSEDGDMFTIVDRMSDEDDYQVARPEFQYFQERVRHSTARNAYYLASRRQARANRFTDDYVMEFRRNVRVLRTTAMGMATDAARFECAASDDQIEALPTIVMKKGETRSAKELFDILRDDGAAGEHNADECGGLMTSYTECAICLCEFEAGDEITALPCGHLFHLTGCVREWLRNHARTCPTCRADICAPSCGSDDVNSHSATMATSEDLT